MLTIRPTKMLARRLGIDVPTAPPAVVDRMADWCAHEFRAGRLRYLIFCNTAALCPVVTYARGVTDEATLIRRLVDTLRMNLKESRFAFHYERWIAPSAVEVQWAPIPDKSILGSINDLIAMAKYALAQRDDSPVELTDWLAATPMSALGMNTPERVFSTLGK